MNHLAMTLAVEEPSVTTVSIRPGVVDTEMQREIRDVHAAEGRADGTGMSASDAVKFHGLHKQGQLLKPEQPGHVMAKLSIDAPASLNGKFLR
jgi:NAD(P)-dependent dehydrogenase (short-subunit alcohol dehydrogenase family)